jgi:type II secretory pathway pseudopilin PulG
MSAGKQKKNRCLTPIPKQSGFTYLALLIAVAVGGGVLAAVGELTSHAQQREKEAELLFAGHQYRQAIAAYYERSPGGAKVFPQKLEDLLEDKRYPMPQRYLRRLYPDPVTGKTTWGLMDAPGGGIIGVYSLAEQKPIKSGGFSREDETFADAAGYADWKFFYTPPKPADAAAPTDSPPGAPAAAPAPAGAPAPAAAPAPASAPAAAATPAAASAPVRAK